MDSSGRRYLRWMTTRRYQLCIQIRAVPKLMLIEAEILELLGPVRVGIAQALDVDATREAALNRGLDELWRKKRKRERQVDLTHRASLALCQLPGVSDGACHDLVEPSAAARDRADQPKASLGASGPDVFPDGPVRHNVASCCWFVTKRPTFMKNLSQLIRLIKGSFRVLQLTRAARDSEGHRSRRRSR